MRDAFRVQFGRGGAKGRPTGVVVNAGNEFVKSQVGEGLNVVVVCRFGNGANRNP